MTTWKHATEKTCEYSAKEAGQGPAHIANDLYSTDEI